MGPCDDETLLNTPPPICRERSGLIDFCVQQELFDGEGAIMLVSVKGIGKIYFVTALTEAFRPSVRILGALAFHFRNAMDHFYWVLPDRERRDSASALNVRASATFPCLSLKSARDASALARKGYILD